MTQHSLRLLRIFTFFFLFSTFGCKSKPSDSEIKDAVTQKLANIPGISVDVSKGVVTLSGQVMAEADKTAAESALAGLAGVASVVNNVNVAPPPPPPVEINPDEVLTQTANAAISALNLSTVSSEVKDGVITLKGTIKRADLPKLMQQMNELKPKKINNQLSIK